MLLGRPRIPKTSNTSNVLRGFVSEGFYGFGTLDPRLKAFCIILLRSWPWMDPKMALKLVPKWFKKLDQEPTEELTRKWSETFPILAPKFSSKSNWQIFLLAPGDPKESQNWPRWSKMVLKKSKITECIFWQTSKKRPPKSSQDSFEDGSRWLLEKSKSSKNVFPALNLAWFLILFSNTSHNSPKMALDGPKKGFKMPSKWSYVVSRWLQMVPKWPKLQRREKGYIWTYKGSWNELYALEKKTKSLSVQSKLKLFQKYVASEKPSTSTKTNLSSKALKTEKHTFQIKS
jgi:hypothetical protein